MVYHKILKFPVLYSRTWTLDYYSESFIWHFSLSWDLINVPYLAHSLPLTWIVLSLIHPTKLIKHLCLPSTSYSFLLTWFLPVFQHPSSRKSSLTSQPSGVTHLLSFLRMTVWTFHFALISGFGISFLCISSILPTLFFFVLGVRWLEMEKLAHSLLRSQDKAQQRVNTHWELAGIAAAATAAAAAAAADEDDNDEHGNEMPALNRMFLWS